MTSSPNHSHSLLFRSLCVLFLLFHVYFIGKLFKQTICRFGPLVIFYPIRCCLYNFPFVFPFFPFPFFSFNGKFSPFYYLYRRVSIAFRLGWIVRWVYWYWQINNDVTAERTRESSKIWSDTKTQSSIGNCFHSFLFFSFFTHCNVLDMCLAYEMNSTCWGEISKRNNKKNTRKHRERFSLYTIY